MLRVRGAWLFGIAAAALGLAAFLLSTSTAQAQLMAVPDSISVSETGGAIQSFPFAVPPGTAGMVPSLSLTYNSQGNNGMVGMGFMLNGLATIGRCPRTKATDGVVGKVNYDANDRFCLDGQRLIVISGTYGADGAEYRTEIESFSKVISRGSAGTGPAWFEVWTKSGQRMEFGNTTDSRILATGKTEARSWMVNKVADTKGNYLSVAYVNDAANGEASPSRIDYTGNAAAGRNPYNSVRFVYTGDRPDKSIAYHAGSLIRATVLLTNIRTYTGDTLVSDYRLTYGAGPATGRMRLNTVTLCDGASICLPATTIGWTSGDHGTFGTTPVSAEQKIPLSHIPFVVGDFNGDGLTDFYTADPNTNGEIESITGAHYVRLSRGDGTFDVITVSAEQKIALSHKPFVIGDFNGDGLTDFYTADPNTNGEIESITGAHYVRLSRGDGTFDIITVSAEQKIALSHIPFVVGDFNGDGLTDFYTADPNTNGEIESITGAHFVHLSNGNGTFGKITVSAEQKIALSHKPFVIGDFNGDGLTDFYTADPNTNGEIESITGAHFVRLSRGDGTFDIISVSAAQKIALSHKPFVIGDFNGDGLTDFYTADPNTNGEIESITGAHFVRLSKGDGTFDIITVSAEQKIALSHRPFVVGDFNGDGLTDFYTADPNTNGEIESVTGDHFVRLSKGDGTFEKITVSAAQKIALTHKPFVEGDFNGDGLTDFYTANPNSNGEIESIAEAHYVRLSSEFPDLLSSVTNGLDVQTLITYRPLTDRSVYTKDRGTSAASYPILDIQGPMQVTSRIESSDGLGGKRVSTYRYAGAKMDLTGRGFLGFREMTSRDEQTGIEQRSVYEQYYPLTLMKKGETRSFNGAVLSSVVSSYDAVDLGGTRRRVFLTQSGATGADLDGSPLPSTTTTYQYDAFSNATQITVATSDGYAKITTNAYTNDTTNWLLGRLTAASVTSTVPDVVSQVPAEDTTPNAFDFTDVTDADRSTVYEDSVVVTGYNRSLTATVAGSGAVIRKNGAGSWGTSVSISPGERLNLRMTSSPTGGAAVSATVTAGGVSANWIVSNSRLITISGNVNGFNLRTAHDALYAAPTGSESPRVHVRVVIEANAIVGATSTATPAFTVGSWPAGIPIQIINQGSIIGAGGNGGHGGSPASAVGATGGPAFHTRYPVRLNNAQGNIAGGGGGGGGGHGGSLSDTAGGGGGGAGVPGGLGATGNPNATVRTGAAGTTLAGGNGGSFNGSAAPLGGSGFGVAGSNASGRSGGGGGGPGGIGGNGAGQNGRAGGQPGVAVDGNSFVTYDGVGGVWGARLSGAP